MLLIFGSLDDNKTKEEEKKKFKIQIQSQFYKFTRTVL